MTRVLLLFISIFTLSFSAFAQKGTVKGVVKDADTGEEVIGASVVIEGTTVGASTNVFGQFEFQADPGSYNLVASFIGYSKFTQQITVADGLITEVNITLASDAQELEAVEVIGKANKESAGALMVERKNASVMVQSIGAEEMSVKGASNVEDAATKISGVSKVGSKGVFVRGLGDRYNNAMLNGLPIPSTDPDKKVIPLDLFPSDVVKNLDMSKTANATIYGDFAGATVNIFTKDYPEDPFFTIGGGISYNSLATGNTFKNYRDGDFEGMGFSGDGRQQPSEIVNFDGNVFPETSGENAVNLFGTSWNHAQVNAPIAMSLNLSGGSVYEVGDEGLFGFVVSGSFENDYAYIEGKTRNLNAQGAPLTDYDMEEWTYSTQTSVLGDLFYQINRKNKIKWNNLYVNTSSNTYAEYFGFNNDLVLDNLFTTRGTYRQNALFVSQLLGEHIIGADERLSLNWGGSYASANGQEPDRKQLAYIGRGEDADLFTLNASNNHRFWSDLNENEYAGLLNFNVGLGKYLEEDDKYRSNLSLGGNLKMKNRDFEWRQFNLKGDQFQYDGFNTNAPDERINELLREGDLSYSEQVDPSRQFFAEQNVYAGYLQYDYAIIPSKLNMLLGARVESSQQTVEYKQLGDLFRDPPQVSSYDTLDFLPSLALKYGLNTKSNFRFAASKTVTRPGFKEIIPFQYQEMIGGALIQGNPDLVNAYNYNFDLGYEIYPNSGELFSVSLFGKRLDSPIEKVAIPESGTLFSFQNADQANVYGVEMELTKRLHNVFDKGSEALSRFIFGLNASYMYTEINLDASATSSTNTSRQLQGASPFILNADLGYEVDFSSNWNGIMTVTYTTFGDRIYATGQEGAGDIFERSYGSLNFIWKNRIADKWSVNLSVKNILNPNIVLEQEFFDYELSNGTETEIVTTGYNENSFDVETFNNGAYSGYEVQSTTDNFQIVNTFKRGLDFSVSLSYTF